LGFFFIAWYALDLWHLSSLGCSVQPGSGSGVQTTIERWASYRRNHGLYPSTIPDYAVHHKTRDDAYILTIFFAKTCNDIDSSFTVVQQ